MNLQQLIELAVLDAMGLLDDDERAQFESAFSAAAPAVQAQVRREQTRLSVIEALLPDVSPPAGLRSAVVDAVRRQILAAGLNGEAETPILPFVRSTGVSRFWRATALGLAAAALALGIAMFDIYKRYNEVVNITATSNQVAQMIEKFGAPYVKDVLFNKDTKRVVMAPVAAGFKGHASLFFSPEWKEAKFFHDGLDSRDGRIYKLAIVDDKDNVVEVLREFEASGGLSTEAFRLPSTAANAKFAVMATDDSGRDQVIGHGQLPSSL